MPDERAPPLPIIQIERFRAFRNRAALELRPLTLLYGRNQVGKSTLLRVLPLLADSIHGSVPALDLKSPALLGATFKELGWLGPEPAPSPSVRIGLPDRGPFMELHLTDEEGLVPNRVDIGDAHAAVPEFKVSFDGNKISNGRMFQADYRGENAGEEWDGPLTFSSLLPAGVPQYAERRLQNIKKVVDVFKRLQWLATSRPATREVLRPSRCCRPDGSDLADLLHDRRAVLGAVSGWLKERPELGESVEVERSERGDWQLRLRRSGGESLPLYLAGEGMRWLLPILLVASWAEERRSDSPTMLAIEEPESRLHPSLQIALFERLLQLLRHGIPAVLETHSVYMLRCMQLAVARGELRPEDVALYWVRRDKHVASIERIIVERDGTLTGWQADTFEEEQQLSRQIFQARWEADGAS